MYRRNHHIIFINDFDFVLFSFYATCKIQYKGTNTFHQAFIAHSEYDVDGDTLNMFKIKKSFPRLFDSDSCVITVPVETAPF